MQPDPRESELRHFLSQRLHTDLSGLALDDALSDAIGVDSLTSLEIMADVEEHFDVYFDESHLARTRTLGNILRSLDEAGGRRPS